MRDIVGFEIAGDGIRNHGMEFCQRIALRCNSPTPRRTPPRDEATGFATRLNLECDFGHGIISHIKSHNTTPVRAAHPAGGLDFEEFGVFGTAIGLGDGTSRMEMATGRHGVERWDSSRNGT